MNITSVPVKSVVTVLIDIDGNMTLAAFWLQGRNRRAKAQATAFEQALRR